MKKWLRFISKGIFAFCLLLLIALAALLVTGVPKPGTFEVENLPRIGIASALGALKSFSEMPDAVKLVGFDPANRLLVQRLDGQAFAIAPDGSSVPQERAFPSVPQDSSLQSLFGNPDIFLFLREKNPQEDRDLMRFNGTTGEVETLAVGGSSVSTFAVAPDDSFVLYLNHDYALGRHTLRRLLLDKTGEAEVVAELEPGLAKIQGFDPEGRHAFVLHSWSEQNSRLYRVDLESGEVVLQFPEEAEGTFYNGTQFTWYKRQRRFLVAPDGKLAWYVRTGTDSHSLNPEFAVLWECDLVMGTKKQLSPNMVGDVGHFALSRDGRHLVYLLLQRGYTRLMAYDRESGDNRELFNRQTEAVDYTFNNTPFLLHPTDPLVYFQTASVEGHRLRVLNLHDGKSDELAVGPARPRKPRYLMREVIVPTREASIGLMEGIQCFLYSPLEPGPGRMPVVLDLHGGPDVLVPPYAVGFGSFFLSRGYSVLVPNYRGSSGYGVSFEQSDNHLRRPRQTEDLEALAAWIATQEELDPARIILTGHSWGGYLTLAGLIAYPELFLGGVSISPATLDPEPDDQPHLIKGFRMAELGDLADSEIRAMCEAISPVTQAHRIQRPLYLIGGSLDARVHVASARKIRDGIKAAGGHPWYLEMTGQGHAAYPNSPLEGIYLLGSVLQFVDGVAAEAKTP